MNVFQLVGTFLIKGADKAKSDIKSTSSTAKSEFKEMGAAGAKGSAQIEEGFDRSAKAANPLVDGIKKIGAAVAAYMSVQAVKDFASACIEAAAEVSAEASAFEQIMGDYSEQAQAKMKEVADATGVVDTRLTGSMTSMTAKFKGLGFGVEEATSLAARGLTIASDAAAFWDKSLADSQSALNSFINGSYEGGESIGLFANDTQMAAYAVEQGIVSATKEWSALDEATKQATRLEYAENMMAMSGATGQAAKEASQYANVKANLAEKWRQFQAIVGEPVMQNVVIPAMSMASGLIDVMTPKVGVIIEKVGAVSDAFSTRFGPGIQKACELAGPIIQEVKEHFEHMGAKVQEVLVPALDFLGEKFTGAMESMQPWIGPLGNVANLLGNILVAAVSAAAYVLGGIMEVFSAVTAVVFDFDAFMQGQPSVIGAAIDGIVAWFESLPSRIKGIFSNAGTWLVNAGRSIIQGLADGIRSMASSATSAISDVLANLRAYLPFSPAKVGPFSGKGWTLYSGQSIVESLAEGISSKAALAQEAMDSTMSGIAGCTANASLTQTYQGASAAYSSAGAGGTTINIYIDGAQVNSDSAIEGAFYNFMDELRRLGLMQGGVS